MRKKQIELFYIRVAGKGYIGALAENTNIDWFGDRRIEECWGDILRPPGNSTRMREAILEGILNEKDKD